MAGQAERAKYGSRYKQLYQMGNRRRSLGQILAVRLFNSSFSRRMSEGITENTTAVKTSDVAWVRHMQRPRFQLRRSFLPTFRLSKAPKQADVEKAQCYISPDRLYTYNSSVSRTEGLPIA